MIYALRLYATTTVCVFPFMHGKLHLSTGKMVYGEAPQLHHMYGKQPGNKLAGSLVVNSYVNEMARHGMFLLSHCGAIAASTCNKKYYLYVYLITCTSIY